MSEFWGFFSPISVKQHAERSPRQRRLWASHRRGSARGREGKPKACQRNPVALYLNHSSYDEGEFCPSTSSLNWAARCLVGILTCSLLSSCTFLSDRDYVKQYAPFQGVHRITVFLQRWPVYLQLPEQSTQDANFIKQTTHFLGPWEPAGNINPRALDVQNIDDALMGRVLLEALTRKGYQPFLAQTLPDAPNPPISVELMMAQYQALDPGWMPFYSASIPPPCSFLIPWPTLRSPTNRPFSLQEVVSLVNPGSQGLIWAGPRAALDPKNSISHAFIYLSLTMFKALDWRPLLQVAGSLSGGRSRAWVPQCPPGPTDEDYWADPAIIQNLMVDNLKCRLRHLLPTAF